MKKNIAVIFGGESLEHEVSLSSCASVLKNINKERFNVFPIGITKQGDWFEYNGDIKNIEDGSWEDDEFYKVSQGEKLLFTRQVDCVFPLLHGRNGEDGTIQGLCKMLKLPFVGSNVLSSAICMDKAYSKNILENNEIPITPYFVVENENYNRDEVLRKIYNKFNFPVIIKPSFGGSSFGVTRVTEEKDLDSAIDTAFKFDKKVLVEKALNLREFKVSILDADTLCVGEIGEIDYKGKKIFDYETKYLKDEEYLIIPNDLDAGVRSRIIDISKKSFEILDCSTMARIDIFMDKDTNEVYVNEVNTIPGFTTRSSFPKLLLENGKFTYEGIIDVLIEKALIDKTK